MLINRVKTVGAAERIEESIQAERVVETQPRRTTSVAAACVAALVLALAGSSSAWPEGSAPDEDRARALAEQMIYRNDGATSYRLVTMISCRFQLKEGSRRCVSRPVRRSIESTVMDVGPQGRDTLTLGIILDPANERDMAFLQADHDDPSRETEQWMYFPALRKLKRIVSESPNQPKTGSVFGSEVAYEDNERLRLGDHRFSLEGEEELDGRQCDLLVAVPTDEHLPRTSYGRQRFWVERRSRAPVKRELYDKRTGALVKTFLLADLVCLGEAWLAKVELVVNHETSRMTLIRTERLAVDVPMDASIFERRALEDTSFREGLLGPLRAAAR
jgi:hypothetical protein